jgi:DNA-binding beta-propeller fold protein YncE
VKRRKGRCLLQNFLLLCVLLLLSTGRNFEIHSKAKKDSIPAGKQITLASSPLFMALNADGRQLAVLHDQGLSLIDIETVSLTENLKVVVRPSPPELYFAPDGQSLYFATGGNRLTRFILKSGQSQWVQEELLALDGTRNSGERIGGLSLSPSGRYLALTFVHSRLLLIYDLSQRVVIRKIPIGENPGQVLFSPDGQKAYLAHQDGILQSDRAKESPRGENHNQSAVHSGQGFVSVVKLQEQEVAKGIEVGIHLCQMCLNKDGSRLYVLDDVGSRVFSIDTLVQEVIEEIPLTIKSAETPVARPSSLCLAPDGKRLFVAMEKAQAIAVIGLGSLSAKSLKETPSRIEGIIPMPGHPRALLFTADGSRLLVGLSVLGVSNLPDEGPRGSTVSASGGIVFVANLPSQKQLEHWLDLFLQSHK